MKAVSELYAPLTGEVVEVNAALQEKPEAINADPHATWMIAIKLADPGDTCCPSCTDLLVTYPSTGATIRVRLNAICAFSSAARACAILA